MMYTAPNFHPTQAHTPCSLFPAADKLKMITVQLLRQPYLEILVQNTKSPLSSLAKGR
jgi:hypothetical protein